MDWAWEFVGSSSSNSSFEGFFEVIQHTAAAAAATGTGIQVESTAAQGCFYWGDQGRFGHAITRCYFLGL